MEVSVEDQCLTQAIRFLRILKFFSGLVIFSAIVNQFIFISLLILW